MRKILLISAIFSFTSVKSQIVGSSIFPTYSQNTGFFNKNITSDSIPKKKLFLTSYKGLSTGISFFKGGSATYLAAPFGLQLNRRLNNNFYAFASVSIVPMFTSFNTNFINPGLNKNFGNSYVAPNGFDIHPAASLGLMYINDAKTFSISGSISAERSTYPILPYYPSSNYHQSPVLRSANSDNR
jgi:hypothetical protein